MPDARANAKLTARAGGWASTRTDGRNGRMEGQRAGGKKQEPGHANEPRNWGPHGGVDGRADTRTGGWSDG